MDTTKEIASLNNILNHFLGFLAVALSGISFFSFNPDMKRLCLVFLLFLYVKKNIALKMDLFIIILVFIALVGYQDHVFGGVTIPMYLTFIAYYILTPYFLIQIIGVDYPKYIINILIMYCFISLLFWGLSNLFPSFYNYTSTLAPRLGTDYTIVNEQFILHTFEPSRTLNNIIRNPGPFNEPGSFAVFLLIALVFNIILSRSRFDRKSLILSITLITTFSTAAYMGLMAILGYFIWNRQGDMIIKFIYLITFSISMFYFVIYADFMANKLITTYQRETTISLYKPTQGRIMGARKALFKLQKYPLLGKGFLGEEEIDYSSPEAAAYGFPAFAAKTGLIVFFIYMLLFYRTIKYYCAVNNVKGRFEIWAYLCLLIQMFAQYFFLVPIFMMIVMSPMFFKSVDSNKIS